MNRGIRPIELALIPVKTVIAVALILFGPSPKVKVVKDEDTTGESRRKQFCKPSSPDASRRVGDRFFCEGDIYRANSTTRFSRMIFTFISPGYFNSACMRDAMARASLCIARSEILPGLTKIRISRPADMA